MFYIYAISSLSRPYIYVGLTQNVENRVARHNSGRERKTKPFPLNSFTWKRPKQGFWQEKGKNTGNPVLEKNN